MTAIIPDDAVIEAMAMAMFINPSIYSLEGIKDALCTPEFQNWLSRQKGSAYLDGGFKAMDKMHGEKS